MSPRLPRLPRRRRARHLLALALTVGALGVALALIRTESPADRYRDRANEICRRSKQEIDVAFGATVRGSASPEQLAAFIGDVLVPELRDRVARLRAVDGGGSLATRTAAVLDRYEEVVDELAADPGAAVASEDPFAVVDAELDDLGLDGCGSAPPT